MLQPEFILEVNSTLYRQRFKFYESKVVYSWKRSPFHYGELSVPRDQLSGEFAETSVFGHDVSRHLLPFLISLFGGALADSGFREPVVAAFGYPFIYHCADATCVNSDQVAFRKVGLSAEKRWLNRIFILYGLPQKHGRK